MNAIFQIIRKNGSEKEPIILGTAFAIKTDNALDNTWYLLTAYHTISELLAKDIPILLRDENSNIYIAQVIYPKCPLNNYPEYGLDFALLTMQSKVQFDAYYLKSFDTPQNCIVRGCSTYYNTIFRSINGTFFYNEKIISQNEKVMQLTLDTKTIYENAKNGLEIVEQKKILNGLSGGPILVKFNDNIVCAGVIGNIFPDSSASYLYGISVETIINKCLEPLCIPFSIYYFEKETKKQNTSSTILYLLLGDDDTFSLEDYNLEVKLWNNISNLFYRDSNILYVLENLIYNNSNCAPIDAIALLRYFYARLLFKKGNSDLALKEFALIKKDFGKISGTAKERLDTLINVRTVIEDTKINDVNSSLNKLQKCGERINNLSCVNELYKNNEAASMYGRGLTNLFSIDYDFSTIQKKSIKKIFDIHSDLIKQHPFELKNQSVVNISLSWLLNIWEFESSQDIELLKKNILEGFQKSLERKNSIFYIQSLITLALEKIMINDSNGALFCIILSSRLTFKLGLSLSHEGIKQLLLFFRKNHPQFFAIFELSYRYSNKNKIEFLNKANIYNLNANISNILALVEDFENINFSDKFDYFKTNYNTLSLYI